jgi:hypothetical protein
LNTNKKGFWEAKSCFVLEVNVFETEDRIGSCKKHHRRRIDPGVDLSYGLRSKLHLKEANVSWFIPEFPVVDPNVRAIRSVYLENGMVMEQVTRYNNVTQEVNIQVRVNKQV